MSETDTPNIKNVKRMFVDKPLDEVTLEDFPRWISKGKITFEEGVEGALKQGFFSDFLAEFYPDPSTQKQAKPCFPDLRGCCDNISSCGQFCNASEGDDNHPASCENLFGPVFMKNEMRFLCLFYREILDAGLPGLENGPRPVRCEPCLVVDENFDPLLPGREDIDLSEFQILTSVMTGEIYLARVDGGEGNHVGQVRDKRNAEPEVMRAVARHMLHSNADEDEPGKVRKTFGWDDEHYALTVERLSDAQWEEECKK